MTKIEEVARAIARKAGHEDWGALPESDGDAHRSGKAGGTWDCKSDFREQARAAIEALRVPNEAMRVCGHNAGWSGVIEGDAPCEEEAAARLWQSMIDAILKEKPE